MPKNNWLKRFVFENVKNLTETNIYEIGKIRVNIFCRLKFFPEFSKIGWGRGGQDNKTFLGLMTMQQSALFSLGLHMFGGSKWGEWKDLNTRWKFADLSKIEGWELMT